MKLKKLFGILLIAVILCAGGLIAACDKDKDNTETNYGISPTSAMFVEGTSSDLNFTLSIGEDTVTSLKQGENTVAEDHWTVENSVLIVKADWLKTLEVGSYQFTLKTSSGKEMKFTVVCYKSAKISPERAEYDWDNPSDVAFTIDLGGASLLGVKIGDTVLSTTQYNFSGNSLTIKSDAVLNACLDGDNECYITTSVGNLEFTIYCFNSVVTAAFDAVAYKVQSTNDEDVVFTFDAVGMEYLIERYTGTEWGDLREEEVVYSPFAHTLTVSGNVLANEYAGIIRYRVSVRDDSDSVFYFAVGAYGKSGGAQIAKNSVEVMNDFDYLADGANFGGQNTAFGTPSVFYAGGATTEIISGENAIEGKSLKITSSYGTEVAWNIFCGVRFGAVVDTVYRVKMDLKLITASDARSPSLVFRLYDGTNDTSEMILDYNSSNDTYTRVANVDKRNTFTYNQQTGVLTVEVYVVPTVSDQHFRLTLANAGRATVILDNYSILKTGMPVSAEVTSADADYVLMDGGSLQTLLLYGDGITFTSVTCDGTALTADDYAIADRVVTFAENWLQTLSVGAHTVTFNYSYINDVYGGTQAAQVSVTITVYEIVLPEQKTVATQKQTSAKESLLYEITSGGYTFAAVSENGIEIDGSKYSYDVENGELLLKADYLNTLSVGLHSFTLTFTAEGQDDYTINIGASVYGDDITHVESTAGVINFNDYAVATNLSGIVDNSIFGTYKSVEPTIEKDSVLGNSLGITESGGGVIVYRALSLNKNYVIRMVFRTENDESIKSLLWKYNAASGESDSINSNWIQNGVITTTKDMRSTIEKRADGAYVWTAYLGAMKAQSDLILYVVTAQKLTIGSVELFETTYVAISETAYNYADYTNTAHFVNTSSFEITDVTQNLYVAQHINAEARNGWSEFRVMSGNIELVSGTDYTLDGNALYINASYLSGLTLNETVTLTLQRGCKNIEGEILWQSATVTVTRTEA